MEWIINSYDRRTDRDGQDRFTTEAAFIIGATHLLRDREKGFESQPFQMGPWSKARAH